MANTALGSGEAAASAPALLEAWAALVGGTSTQARAAGVELVDRYLEPHRRYHDLRHVAYVLERIGELGGSAKDPAAVALAAFFHDAVYDPLAEDNEERSAALAESMLSGVGAADRAAEVARLVRLTRTHTPAKGDRNGEVLCDADLAILGAGPTEYATYAADVRQEYHAVEDAAFRAGRSEVLAGLLARPTIYATPLGRQLWEARARRNLETELALLGAQPRS